MLDKVVTILMDLLDSCDKRGLPLEDLEEALADRIRAESDIEGNDLANQAIRHALDNWLIDQTIDYRHNERGVEVGPLIWFCRKLTQEESEELKQLPDIEKETIRILREQQSEEGLGTMRERDLLEHLRSRGFETEFTPMIEDYVSDYFTTEDGELVEWIYLVPQFELSEDYKQGMRELDEMSLQKELRRERED
ncbi:hypothetical protein EU538_04140 [Candidatus Thorarchaeota archaeon]|nr:MAG: hypothetical protein EU538_04140 [Candidatus Thorarchaeota archaeon]